MKSIRLRENVGLRFTAEGCEIHGPRGIKIVDPQGQHLEFLRRLFASGIPSAEAATLPLETRRLLQLLSDRKLLRQHEADYSRDEIWLSHFVADARQSLKNLTKKKILIVGCGGTGAIVADHLARAGVRHFILIDGAKLDAPDLNRQWTYSYKDVGKKKVRLLARYLCQHFGAKVRTLHRHLLTPADFIEISSENLDLIIGAADRPRFVIERLLLKLSDEKNTPILFGSVGVTDDCVGQVLDNPRKRDEEQKRLDYEESLNISEKIAQGSLCLTNTLAAAKIGLAAYRFLMGIKV